MYHLKKFEKLLVKFIDSTILRLLYQAPPDGSRYWDDYTATSSYGLRALEWNKK
jgi:hypothetical protein